MILIWRTRARSYLDTTAACMLTQRGFAALCDLYVDVTKEMLADLAEGQIDAGKWQGRCAASLPSAK